MPSSVVHVPTAVRRKRPALSWLIALGLTMGPLTAEALPALALTGSTPPGTTAPRASVPVPGTVAVTPSFMTTVYDPLADGPDPATMATQPYLDVSGHPTDLNCPGLHRSYGLMKFQLPTLPTGAVLTGVRLRLTSIGGYAYDGQMRDLVLNLPNAADFDPQSVTWETPPAGVLTPDVASSGDDRQLPTYLGDDKVFRAACNVSPTDPGTPIDPGQVQTKHFPQNQYDDDFAADPATPRGWAESNALSAVNQAYAQRGGKLALELFNPTSPVPGYPTGAGYAARYYSHHAADANVRPQLLLSFAWADISQAVPLNGGSSLGVRVGVAGEPNRAYPVAITGAGTCEAGKLGGGQSKLGHVTVTTDAQGVGMATAELGLGESSTPGFVDAAVDLTGTTGDLSASSECLPVGPDNDIWPRALGLDLNQATARTGSIKGFVDRPGVARWYRFPVQPGSQLRVRLTGAADYDLALFRDIGDAYHELTSLKDLTMLSAEFAPSVFSPSVFSPSVFSPSVFSPDAFAPSVFSPSVFSPSVFSPSVFSPSVFSPSVFSPSVFSPSVFSPSVFSPSVFSPTSFTLDPTLPPEVNFEAFASAQDRTIVAVSATEGTGNESVVADTWNNAGYYYVRVSGRNGASSSSSPFEVTVDRTDNPACVGVSEVAGTETAPASQRRTVILLDSSRTPGSAAELSTLRDRLATFAARPEVAGAVVDLATNTRVQQLWAQAGAHTDCVYATNLVAAAAKDVVDAYRSANPTLKYVVVAGADGTIPFFRYPDEGLLGPESDYAPPLRDNTAANAGLRLNYVLGQDAYGALDTLSLGGSELPLPDLAVGRLVESASEMTGMLDAYLSTADGTVARPTSSLVTGYDFLADTADHIQEALSAGLGSTGRADSLITANGISPQDSRSWTAAQLAEKLFNSRHDLAFLGGHFSANSALAADFSTELLSTELSRAPADFTNAVIFSIGCHSGFNIDDRDAVSGVTAPLDWVQAFAQRKATVIAGTGYQYGDTEFLEFSERIYAGFADQLRYGEGPVAIGDALVRSKRAYLAATPDPRGLHRKSLVQATVFGLPMLAVNLPSGRLPAPTDTSVISGTTTVPADPGNALGLSSADLTLHPQLATHTVNLTGIGTPDVTATYLSGPAGVLSNPAEPALPLVSTNVSVDGRVLRGVGFRGGSYTDSTVVPLTGAPTTELRGVHAPFSSPVFYPMRLATVNYTDAISGGATRLLVTPAQHRAIAGELNSTLRRFDQVGLKLFYSARTDRPALAAAPSLSGITAAVSGADVLFSAEAVTDPAAGVQQVWITYTGDRPRWASLDLKQCAKNSQGALPADCGGVEESTRWVGRLAGGAADAGELSYIVQAVNGVGLVAMDDNFGAYYAVVPPTPPSPPADTTVTLSGLPDSAVFGSNETVGVRLLAGDQPVAGKAILVTLGTTARFVTTASDGRGQVNLPLNALPGTALVQASWAGDSRFAASSVAREINISKAPTRLSLTIDRPAGASGPAVAKVHLEDNRGGPMGARSVWLVVPNSPVVPLTTDYLGNARADITLPSGASTVQASYLLGVAGVAEMVDPTYLGSRDSASTTVASITVTGPSSTLAANPYRASASLTPPVAGAVWSLVDAPSWLAIDAATGVISGTVPGTATGSFSYTVRAEFDGTWATRQLQVGIIVPADLGVWLATPVLQSGKAAWYAVVVTNYSRFASPVGATVTDRLPAGLSYAGVSGKGWSCRAAGQLVTCTEAVPLGANRSTMFQLKVKVTAAPRTRITNEASVAPLDANRTNNQARWTATVK